MKLKDDFFSIINFYQINSGIDYTIRFNPEHTIYQAHFPGNPITPGVCIIQIVKELTEEALKKELFLKKVNNVKFLNVINPLEHNEVTFSISFSTTEDDAHKINAVVSDGNNTFAKLSMLFVNQ
jgi:3-hydroxyacyl-[acyl-carrier-protein] dehydratase